MFASQPIAAKQITASRNADGRLEVVYISPTNGGLNHTWQTTPDGAWVSSSLAQALGGSPANKLAMAPNLDGRLQIFYTGPNNAIFTNSQLTPGGAWGGEQPLGGAALQIAVGQNLDGRLEVFVVGTDNQLYHNFQLQLSGSAWSGWIPMAGSPSTQLAVGRNADGRLEVFYNGPNNWIFTNTQVCPNGNCQDACPLCPSPSPNPLLPRTQGLWTGETPMGGAALQFSVEQNTDGRLEVLIVGTDNAGWHTWQTTPNGSWAAWTSFGGWLSQLATARNSDGRLEVFCMGVNNALYHNWQTTPGGAWSGWQPFYGAARQIATAINADGRLDVFVVGTDNFLYHNMQGS